MNQDIFNPQLEVERTVRQGIKSVSLHGVEATIEGKIAQS